MHIDLCIDCFKIQLGQHYSITPSLHKLLAHSSELIASYNSGNGLKISQKKASKF